MCNFDISELLRMYIVRIASTSLNETEYFAVVRRVNRVCVWGACACVARVSIQIMDCI